jgi:hypothetical protein
MPAADDDRTARARLRERWPIVRRALGDEADDDLSADTTPGQRVAMMRHLAEEAWRVAGRPLPTYDRAQIPARFFPAGTRRPDDED